jgi:hypothetical protein
MPGPCNVLVIIATCQAEGTCTRTAERTQFLRAGKDSCCSPTIYIVIYEPTVLLLATMTLRATGLPSLHSCCPPCCC